MHLGSGGRRARLMAGAAFALAMTVAGAASAQAINIEPQPLTSALNEFGHQTNLSVVYTPDLASQKVSPGVLNSNDPEAALRQLLAGTGLTFKRSGDAFLIEQQGEGGSSPQAQSAGNAVEALIVTAQKREEDIQDVPIAISAFSQRALEEQKIEGGFDLLKAIPNVTFSKSNFTGYNFSIRGIGTKAVSPTTDPGVAVEFNDTPMIRNRLFEQEYFDVERVEVLRGPQGTLHGRNATSGVINVISAKPQLDEFEGSIKLEGGNYNAQRVVGMVNAPIIQNVLGIRLAGAMTKRDGYGLNLYDNSDADDRDLWSARLTIGFEPTDRIRADLIWEHFEEDDARQRTGKQLCKHDPGLEYLGNMKVVGKLNTLTEAQSIFSQGCLPVSLYDDAAFGTPNGFAIPFIGALAGLNTGGVLIRGVDPYGNTTQSRDLRAFYSQIPTVYQAKANVIELNVGFDITDNLTLTSQTAYNEDDYYASQDFNRYTTVPAFRDTTLPGNDRTFNGDISHLAPDGVFCDPQLGCSDTIIGQDISQAESTQFSQEIRLQSNFDGPVNFSFGANYTKYETVEDYYVFFNGITLATIVSLNTGLFGSSNPDRASFNPDCTVDGGFVTSFCVPIEDNPISEIQDYGHNYFLSRNPYKLRSKAVFGEMYWQMQDDLKLTVGLRYTDDEKIFTPIPSQTALTPRQAPDAIDGFFDPGLPLIGTGFGYPAEPDIKLGWQEVTGRIGLDWKPELSFTDETLLYGFVSRGYKGGGMNPPSVGLNYEDAEALGIYYPPSAPPSFDPEFVNAFELGTKNTLAEGRLILNAGAFYYDYEGYQVSKIVDRSAQNENFDARIWGLELESTFSPTRALRFNATLGYLNTRVADGSMSLDTMNRLNGRTDWVLVKPSITLMSNCVVPLHIAQMVMDTDPYTDYMAQACPGGSTLGASYRTTPLPDGTFYDPADHPEANYGAGFETDVSGNELPNAPHWTANIGAQYRRSLPGGWDATLRGDAYWQSQSYHRIYNTQYDKLHGWSNFNVSLWFENPEWGVKAEVYVKNLLDATPITDAFLNSDDSALTTNIFTLDPRLIGVSVRKEF